MNDQIYLSFDDDTTIEYVSQQWLGLDSQLKALKYKTSV